MIRTALCVGGLLALCATTGCARPAPKPPAAEAHAHVHGPHDGELIELGEEEYHAELVQNEAAKTVTMYLLDGAAKNPATTAEPEITISVTLGGTATPFKLAAKPQAGDEPGKSSRFESADPNLGLALENETAKRELSVKIGGKAYAAPFEHFEHHHHGDDHGHAHSHEGEGAAKK